MLGKNNVVKRGLLDIEKAGPPCHFGDDPRPCFPMRRVAVQGEHPDWDDYRAAMVRDRRLVVRLRAERAYGMVHRG